MNQIGRTSPADSTSYMPPGQPQASQHQRMAGNLQQHPSAPPPSAPGMQQHPSAPSPSAPAQQGVSHV